MPASEPNAAHKALVQLESAAEVSIITQNIDDLQERAGSSRVLHLHGELRKARSVQDPEVVVDVEGGDLDWGEPGPDGAQLRPHVVWFGEMVPMMEPAAELVRSADRLLVIGTSLNVYPAASLVHAVYPGTPVHVFDPGSNGSRSRARCRTYSRTRRGGLAYLGKGFLSKQLGHCAENRIIVSLRKLTGRIDEGTTKSPLFVLHMIDIEKVREWASERCVEKELFLVELSITSSNQIKVLVDAMGPVSIDSCVSVSRAIESQLDRDAEDFELTVSSAGVGNPLKVWPQYVKNVGREVKVRFHDGTEIKGMLEKAEDDTLFLRWTKKEKVEGKKKKQSVEYTGEYKLDKVAEIKLVLPF